MVDRSFKHAQQLQPLRTTPLLHFLSASKPLNRVIAKSPAKQAGASFVNTLCIILLLALIAVVIYLFLPEKPSDLLPQNDNSENFPSTNTVTEQPAEDFSRAELQQLKPVEEAEPELKRIAREIAEQREQAQVGQAEPNQHTESAQTPAEPSAAAATASQHVIGDSPKTQLPTRWLGEGGLTGSDDKVREAVAKMEPSSVLVSWLVDEELLRHFVVLMDNIANGDIPSKQMVLKSPAGELAVESSGEAYILSPTNYERYSAYTKLLSALPPETVMNYYQQFYPLLQQAYAELGYPKRSFHYRLLDAVEVVLNAPMPDPEQRLSLQRPSVMYTYADEALEQRSDVQKLLLRMGAQNASLLKESLWQWKRLLIQLDHR